MDLQLPLHCLPLALFLGGIVALAFWWCCCKRSWSEKWFAVAHPNIWIEVSFCFCSWKGCLEKYCLLVLMGNLAPWAKVLCSRWFHCPLNPARRQCLNRRLASGTVSVASTRLPHHRKRFISHQFAFTCAIFKAKWLVQSLPVPQSAFGISCCNKKLTEQHVVWAKP